MNAAELRRLSTFKVIATCGGVTAAAAQLRKTPGAVHHDLKSLESALGRPLFERVGRRLRLTLDGKALAAAVDSALGDLDRAYAGFRNGTLASTPLRLACVSGFGRYRLAPRLLDQLPEARRLELEFGSHEAVLHALMSDKADWAVTYRPVVSAPIRCERLDGEELVFVRRRTEAPPPELLDLMQLRYVTYDEYEYVFGRWFADMAGAQPERLSKGDHTGELEEALASVALGRGVTIAPRDAVVAGPWRGDLEPLQLTAEPCRNAVYLLRIGETAPSADAALIRSCARPCGRSRAGEASQPSGAVSARPRAGWPTPAAPEPFPVFRPRKLVASALSFPNAAVWPVGRRTRTSAVRRRPNPKWAASSPPTCRIGRCAVAGSPATGPPTSSPSRRAPGRRQDRQGGARGCTISRVFRKPRRAISSTKLRLVRGPFMP